MVQLNCCLRDDEEIVMAAACSNSGYKFFSFASERLRSNRDFVLKVSKVSPCIIEFISKELCQDREIIMNAVSFNGYLLKHASEQLKSDREIVEKAISSEPTSLGFASEHLMHDLELFTKAVATKLTQHLSSQKEMMEKIDDSTFVKSIENESLLLLFPDSVKRNRKHAIKAVSNSMNNIGYVPYDLIDKEFIMEISPKEFDLLLLPLKWRSDRDIILKALESNGKSIVYISDEFKNEFKHNKEILLKAMKTDSIPFLYASEELQNDRDFVLESVTTNGMVLNHVPPQFKLDREVVLAAVKNDGDSIQFVATCCFLKDREIMWNTVQNVKLTPDGKRYNPLQYGSFEIRSDRELVLEAVRHDCTALQYAVLELRCNEEFITQCVEINISCLMHAHYQLRYNADFLKRLNKTSIIRERTNLHTHIDIEGLLGFYPKLKELMDC